jgi:hypothetical protein
MRGPAYNIIYNIPGVITGNGSAGVDGRNADGPKSLFSLTEPVGKLGLIRSSSPEKESLNCR